MPSVQIKNVPDDVHLTLRRRAEASGQSLQQYLLDRLTHEARQKSLDEVLERAGRRSGEVDFDFALKALDVDRR